MAALGIPQIVVEKLLNHVSGGTQSPIALVYNRYSYMPEMRQAVLTYERWLTTLTEPTGINPCGAALPPAKETSVAVPVKAAST